MAAPKSVLITGCSNGGLGSALALAFATHPSKNLHIFATARSVSKMSDLAENPNITLLPLDVSSRESISCAVTTVSAATGGRLDYLVNNAGRNRYMPILDEDLDVARAVFETNVWGAVAVIQGFRELVISARGTVVSVTSVGGHCNVPYMGVYGASKRSLEIITETLRLELAPFGVRVVSLVTGAVDSLGKTHCDGLTLPEDSLYKSIEADIIQRAVWNDGVPRESTTKWANNVAGKIVGGTSGLLWAGGSAGAMWLFEKVLPAWAFDKLMTMGQGLDKLGQKNSVVFKDR
ncbi:short-chain dehydrogenase [Aspergillus ustus]|uniref:Short-chain dehydrogenase n=1 Tax=Aspergillus ustus TaxID=40382 RepID=A0A0C1BWF9_ASPUT|nr:short-chain dehydrogenase [Aspergillus ustus]